MKHIQNLRSYSRQQRAVEHAASAKATAAHNASVDTAAMSKRFSHEAAKHGSEAALSAVDAGKSGAEATAHLRARQIGRALNDGGQAVTNAALAGNAAGHAYNNSRLSSATKAQSEQFRAEANRARQTATRAGQNAARASKEADAEAVDAARMTLSRPRYTPRALAR